MNSIHNMLATPLIDLTRQRIPDFYNLLAVLQHRKPSRSVLYELWPDVTVGLKLPGVTWLPDTAPCAKQRNFFEAYRLLGYDYCVLDVGAWPYKLVSGSLGDHGPHLENPKARGYSLNENVMISDMASFERFVWPTHNEAEYARMAEMAPYLPGGMKLVFNGSSGMEEGLIDLTGYDNLCFLMYDAPELIQAIVDTVHAAGRPIILHSCGQLETVMDEIIDVCQYNAKQSFEDTITPVEEALDRWGQRIAILGGVDVDFLCRRTPAEIFGRSRALIEKTRNAGYALGSGNTIADYIPSDHYIAMNKAALMD